MTDERRAAYLYQRLINDGYLIKPDGDRWHITEPKETDYPQERRGLSTLDECVAWADGIQMGRRIAKARHKPAGRAALEQE